MDNYNSQQSFSDYTVVDSGARAVPKKFMANVFLWMFAALGLSALFAYLFASNAELMGYLYASSAKGVHMTGLGYAVAFAPLGFVLLISMAYNRMSSFALTLCFLLFSTIMGMSLSSVLLIYTSSSVLGCFISTSLLFGVMAIMGYTTDKDLTSFGRLMTMGLTGIIIASIVNMFLHSSQMGYIISIIGVMVFVGLTAYDVQKLKRIGEGIGTDGSNIDDAKKLSIMGALTLYLDFVNLFLLLLQLFGKRNDE